MEDTTDPRNNTLPFDQLTGSALLYQRAISMRSQVIYISVILMFAGGMASLPLIHASVGVGTAGIIRPASEVTPISSLVNGRVTQTFIRDNKEVTKGDVLVVVESEGILEREKYLRARLGELKPILHDLRLLIQGENNPLLMTSLCRQDWSTYQQRLSECEVRYMKVKADHDRNEKLHRQGVIPDAELESYVFDLDKVIQERALIRQSAKSQWQQEHLNYDRELMDISSRLAELLKEKENLLIRAPVSGILQSLEEGIYPGSLVFADQSIARISPDTTLIVEAFVSPGDIGLLRVGMPASFRIDAFTHTQWGMASGRILEISDDIRTIGGTAMFKVRCSLASDCLRLRNGYTGYLKKGMTLQARFTVARRTIWQLLSDRMEDWLNPYLAKNVAGGHQ